MLADTVSRARDQFTLAGVPLFASLDEQELADAAGRFEERSVGEGVDLVGEGAAGYS